MTDYTEMVKRLRACAEGDCRHFLRVAGEACVAPLLREAADAIEKLCAGEDDGFTVETAVFDQEEVHDDCTVVIWRNSVTGEESVGWYENNKEEYKNV